MTFMGLSPTRYAASTASGETWSRMSSGSHSDGAIPDSTDDDSRGGAVFLSMSDSKEKWLREVFNESGSLRNLHGVAGNHNGAWDYHRSRAAARGPYPR